MKMKLLNKTKTPSEWLFGLCVGAGFIMQRTDANKAPIVDELHRPFVTCQTLKGFNCRVLRTFFNGQ